MLDLIIKDDSGLFNYYPADEYTHPEEQFCAAIDSLIEWFESNASDIYTDEDSEVAIKICEGEKEEVKQDMYDLSEEGEVFVIYGFEFILG